MKGDRITGVSRADRFSPNCESNDTEIFNAVFHELCARGFSVNKISETDLSALASSDASLFFSMARSSEALGILRRKEESGVPVVNSPKSLLFYNRSNITRLFTAKEVPMPRNEVLGKGDTPSLPFPFWLKRGEAYTQSRDDVVYIGNSGDLHSAIDGFAARGIFDIVANEHLPGDLVKFYGVAGTDFFHTYYPTESEKPGKFGLEQINGRIHNYAYSREALHKLCSRVSRLLDFVVYGGDCVVDEYGEFRIIDFNDWPSFSCCREEAAAAIAGVLQTAADRYPSTALNTSVASTAVNRLHI